MARNKRMNGRLRGRPPRIPVESMDLVAMADASPKKIPPSQCQVSEAATIATLTFGSFAEDVKVAPSPMPLCLRFAGIRLLTSTHF